MSSSSDNLQEQLNYLRQENESLKQELQKLEQGSKQRKSAVINTTIKGVRFFAGADLRKSFDRVYEELPQVTKPAFAQLSASVVKRLTRIGFFTILFAALPVLILIIQTIILIQQNNKLETQNQKIQNQVYLEEASRRNNLVFLMDSTLDQINDEIGPNNGYLSEPVVGRIKSLMYGFRPYRFLEDDQLSEPLSVEKGQFLLALMNSGIKSQSLQKVFQASFSNIYLKKVNLFNKVLDNIDMPFSDLQGADLSFASFKSASIHDTNFSNAKLPGANLNDTDLRKSLFTDTNLSKAKLNAALLENASFQGANLTGAVFDKAHVANKDWFKQLEKWNVIGKENIKNTYRLDGPHKNEYDETFYILERK